MAVVGDLKDEASTLLSEVNLDRRSLSGVLGRVLKRLQTTEVHRGLQFCRVTPGAIASDGSVVDPEVVAALVERRRAAGDTRTPDGAYMLERSS